MLIHRPPQFIAIPPPPDLGFPPRFPSWRPVQVQAVHDALVDIATNRIYAGCVPTGSGKTLLVMLLGRVLGGRTLILTVTTALQRQFVKAFGAMGVVDLQGRARYECPIEQGANCENGPCCGGVLGKALECLCEHDQAVEAARRAPVVVMNYAKWMSMVKTGQAGQLGKFELLVLDEAHAVEHAVSSALTLNITDDQVAKWVGKLPVNVKTVESWVSWATSVLPVVKRKMEGLKKKAQECRGDRELRLLKSIRDLVSALEIIAGNKKGLPWVIRHDNPEAGDSGGDSGGDEGGDTGIGAEKTWTLVPLWPRDWIEDYLFNRRAQDGGIDKVAMLSGTFTRKALSLTVPGYIGSKVKLRSYPAAFLPERFRIRHIPTCRVDSKWNEDDKQTWVQFHLQTMHQLSNKKGIVHTGSYARSWLLVKRAGAMADQIVWNEDAGDTKRALDEYISLPAPCTFVTPSMVTGADFPGVQCEYIIYSKLPQVHTGDPVIAARSEIDKLYPNHLCAMALQQGCARGMRGKKDACDVRIPDDHAQWFMRQARREGLMAEYFWDYYGVVAGLPEPLPKLRDGEDID